MKLHILIIAAMLGLVFNANSASTVEETRFLAAVQKAFENKDAEAFLSLYCWDRVPDFIKSASKKTNPVLMDLKVDSITLVDALPALAKSEFVREGVTYRPNLPVTKQIEVAHSVSEKKMKAKVTIPVGEKEGKLYITSAAPAK